MRLLRVILIAMILVSSFIPVIVLQSREANAQTWWDASWAYRKVLSFNMSDIATNIVNNAVSVNLTSNNFDFGLANADGSDIRFVDGDDATALSYEIEFWDSANRTANLWVRVPQLNGGSDFTDFMYMYYGNAGAIDAQNVPDVWSGKTMAAVYHFGQNSIGTTTLVDSLGTTNGTITMGTGEWGMGVLNFTNPTTYININGVEAIMDGWNTGSIVMWTNTTSANIVTFGDTAANSYFGWDTANMYVRVAGVFQWRKAVSVPAGERQVVLLLDDIAPYYYLNGVQPAQAFEISVNTTVWLDDVPGIDNGRVGSLNQNGAGESITFNGYASELRFYQDVLTNDEIELDQKNRIDALINYGSTDPEPTMETLQPTLTGVDKDGIITGSFTGNVSALGAAPYANVWINYGESLPYTSKTNNVTATTVGVFTATMPTNLTPNQTYNNQAAGGWTSGEGYGTNITFAFTVPTLTTVAASNISMDADGVTSGNFTLTITDMGHATDAYMYFDYGLTTAYGNSTTNTTVSANVTLGQNIPANLTPGQTYHYSGNTSVGSITSTGGDSTFTLTMPSITSDAANNVTMDQDGVTTINFAGNITDTGVATSTYALSEYGLTTAYGTATSNITRTDNGTFNIAGPNNLTPGETYHFRIVVQNGVVTQNGSDASATFTMPSLSTSPATNVVMHSTQATLNGVISAMGVATGAYVYFEYEVTPGVWRTSPEVLATATGTYSYVITGFQPDVTLSYRFVERVGSVYSYGSYVTFLAVGSTPYSLTINLIPLAFIAVILIGAVGIILLGGLNITTVILLAFWIILGIILQSIIISTITNMW